MHDPERTEYNRELGARLRVARKGASLSIEEAARRLRLEVNTYLKYELGDRQFPMHLVLEFSVMTGFSPGFIVTGFPDSEWKAGGETGTFMNAHDADPDSD